MLSRTGRQQARVSGAVGILLLSHMPPHCGPATSPPRQPLVCRNARTMLHIQTCTLSLAHPPTPLVLHRLHIIRWPCQACRCGAHASLTAAGAQDQEWAVCAPRGQPAGGCCAPRPRFLWFGRNAIGVGASWFVGDACWRAGCAMLGRAAAACTPSWALGTGLGSKRPEHLIGNLTLAGCCPLCRRGQTRSGMGRRRRQVGPPHCAVQIMLLALFCFILFA